MPGGEKGYRLLEHVADIYVEAWGRNLEEAFEEAARAMFESMANLGNVRPEKKVRVEIEADNVETLLVDWLNELLFYVDAEGLLLSEFKVEKIEEIDSGYRLKGYAAGEPINPEKHELKVEVKAATYGLMKIEQTPEGARLRVLFDI